MRLILSIGFASLLLAGCGADQPVPAPAPADTAPVLVDPAARAPQGRPAAVKDGTIDGVVATVTAAGRATLRYDRMRKADSGDQERQVFVEVLGESAKDVEGSVVAMLTADGFAASGRFNDENGYRVQLSKRGHQPIRLLLRDRGVGPALNDPAATSSLYLRQVTH